MLLKGLCKAEPRPTTKCLPLTSDLLACCISTLSSGYLSPPIDKVLESMFLLASYGFLCCSEFSTPPLVYQPTQPPLYQTFPSSLPTPSSSNSNSARPTSPVNLNPFYLFRLDSFLSPYEPICNYVTSRLANQASPQDPLFISETGQVATRFWFHHHFRQILSRSGIPPELYSGHSFHIGATSTASRQGNPDHTIKILGLLGIIPENESMEMDPPTQSLGFPDSLISHCHQPTPVHQSPPSSYTLQTRLPLHPSIPSSLDPHPFIPLPSTLTSPLYPRPLHLAPPTLHPSPRPLNPSLLHIVDPTKYILFNKPF